MFLRSKLDGLVVWTRATYSISSQRRLLTTDSRPAELLALENAVLQLILDQGPGPDAHEAFWSAASDSSSRFCGHLHAHLIKLLPQLGDGLFLLAGPCLPLTITTNTGPE